MGWLQDIYQFFIDLVSYAAEKVWALVVEGLIYLISVIPDPCCVTEAVSAFSWLASALSSGGVFQWLAWMFSLIQFEFALRVMLCALLARFIVRRLPIIG
jgi:hypothetical protein